MRIVFWLIFLCAAAPAMCGAVAFPVLEAPAVYSGGVESESVRYDATLLLNPDHLFILRERMMRADGRGMVSGEGWFPVAAYEPQRVGSRSEYRWIRKPVLGGPISVP